MMKIERVVPVWAPRHLLDEEADRVVVATLVVEGPEAVVGRADLYALELAQDAEPGERSHELLEGVTATESWLATVDGEREGEPAYLAVVSHRDHPQVVTHHPCLRPVSSYGRSRLAGRPRQPVLGHPGQPHIVAVQDVGVLVEVNGVQEGNHQDSVDVSSIT